MKNFPVNIVNLHGETKEYWISRSVAVVGFIFTLDDGIRVLAVKRGKGCPNEVGKWCCPCGYIDYDETLKQAVAREIKEETNLTVNQDSLQLFRIGDKPEGQQNISICYFDFKKMYAGQTITGEFGEPDEIDDVEWIALRDLNQYDWAFDHDKIINSDAIKQLISQSIKKVRYDN